MLSVSLHLQKIPNTFGTRYVYTSSQHHSKLSELFHRYFFKSCYEQTYRCLQRFSNTLNAVRKSAFAEDSEYIWHQICDYVRMRKISRLAPILNWSPQIKQKVVAASLTCIQTVKMGRHKGMTLREK
jgi:hypothetical protein